MQKQYLSLLLCMAVAGFANAADLRQENPELKRCLSTSNGSQEDAACYGEELTRLEKKLDELVAKLSDNVSAPDLFLSTAGQQAARSDLLSSQEHWRHYRDDYCRYGATLVNGSGRAIYGAQCRIEVTKHRINELSERHE